MIFDVKHIDKLNNFGYNIIDYKVGTLTYLRKWVNKRIYIDINYYSGKITSFKKNGKEVPIKYSWIKEISRYLIIEI